MSPADSFGTAIGVGIELTNPISAKLLADRVATLSELRYSMAARYTSSFS
ncbi:MAG: hypothetical protein N838_16780 [Thiohalocapsa sp. PB-PSB1]|nr:MAG: hypothetical protein N838_16780 [Thiohalocapsa sp. PB-PSB1]